MRISFGCSRRCQTSSRCFLPNLAPSGPATPRAPRFFLSGGTVPGATTWNARCARQRWNTIAVAASQQNPGRGAASFVMANIAAGRTIRPSDVSGQRLTPPDQAQDDQDNQHQSQAASWVINPSSCSTPDVGARPGAAEWDHDEQRLSHVGSLPRCPNCGLSWACSADWLLRPRPASKRSSPAPRAVWHAGSSGAEASSVAIVTQARVSCARHCPPHGASGTRNAAHMAAHQDQPDHADVVVDAVALTLS